MKCKDCPACRFGWFSSKPDEYVCIGVPKPFVINDINHECTEYEDNRNKKVCCTNHKYLRELFSDGNIPFPYSEEDYHDFDERDTFGMDCTLTAWLYECLRYFQDEASKTVDFSFHKFNIDGDELTQAQCIDRMVNDCKIIITGDNWDEQDFENINAAKDDLFKVLSKVYWAMWW